MIRNIYYFATLEDFVAWTGCKNDDYSWGDSKLSIVLSGPYATESDAEDVCG